MVAPPKEIPAPTSVTFYALPATQEIYGDDFNAVAERATDQTVYGGLGAFQSPESIPEHSGPMNVLVLRPEDCTDAESIRRAMVETGFMDVQELAALEVENPKEYKNFFDGFDGKVPKNWINGAGASFASLGFKGTGRMGFMVIPDARPTTQEWMDKLFPKVAPFLQTDGVDFTPAALAHELGHVAMNHPPTSELKPDARDRTETAADIYAARLHPNDPAVDFFAGIRSLDVLLNTNPLYMTTLTGFEPSAPQYLRTHFDAHATPGLASVPLMVKILTAPITARAHEVERLQYLYTQGRELGDYTDLIFPEFPIWRQAQERHTSSEIIDWTYIKNHEGHYLGIFEHLDQTDARWQTATLAVLDERGGLEPLFAQLAPNYRAAGQEAVREYLEAARTYAPDLLDPEIMDQVRATLDSDAIDLNALACELTAPARDPSTPENRRTHLPPPQAFNPGTCGAAAQM